MLAGFRHSSFVKHYLLLRITASRKIMESLEKYSDDFFSIMGIRITGDDNISSHLKELAFDEQVAYFYNLLARTRQFPPLDIRATKCEEEAEEYLALGKEAFTSNNDVFSIKYYTVCVALSAADGLQSYLAYAYRSASLFRLERFSACLIDLNRALNGAVSLPKNLESILLQRKKICIAKLKEERSARSLHSNSAVEVGKGEDDQSNRETVEKQEDGKCLTEQPIMNRSKKKKLKRLRKLKAKKIELSVTDKFTVEQDNNSFPSAAERQKKSVEPTKMLRTKQVVNLADHIDEEMMNPDYENKFPLPTIADPNDMIPNASAKVKINFSEEYGRHLVAVEDVKPGDILLAERPFASVLFPNLFYSTCRYCFVRCEALISCQKCLLGTYCSEKCRSKAFNEFHRVECPILYQLMKLEVIGDTHLAFRLLLIATKQGSNLRYMMQHPLFKSPMEKYYGPIEGQYLSEDYANVHNLLDHHDKLIFYNLLRKCHEAAILLYLLKHTTFFGHSEDYSSKVDINCLSEEEAFAGTLLLKFLLLSACNSYSLEDTLEIPKFNQTDEESYHISQTGYGLYSLHSLMNHSCDPNTISKNHKNSVVCYAVQPIKKGEQIFSKYHWDYTKYDKEYRQCRLFIEYFFNCCCDACKFEWDQICCYENVKPKRISNKITEKELRNYEKRFKTFMSKESENTASQEDVNFVTEFISVFHRYVKQPYPSYAEALEFLSFLLAKRGNMYEVDEDMIICKLAFLRKHRLTN